MIKFSIITVCLNAGNDLIDTVDSTLKQTYINYELIIKDGLSQDGSIEKLPKSDRIKLIREKDLGIYEAMNQGIDAASGDFLIFMNAGDRFADDTVLERLSEAMTESGVSLYYGYCYNETMRVHTNSPQRLTAFFCYRSMICHQAMVFERRYLQQKKYDCSYRVSADKELLMYTVVGKQLKTKYLPVVIARYKGSGFSEKPENRKRILAEGISLREKYYSKYQRVCNEIRLKITFPKLRRAIVNNPKLVRTYKRLIGFIYGNR